jgi:hypothetical protein
VGGVPMVSTGPGEPLVLASSTSQPLTSTSDDMNFLPVGPPDPPIEIDDVTFGPGMNGCSSVIVCRLNLPNIYNGICDVS